MCSDRARPKDTPQSRQLRVPLVDAQVSILFGEAIVVAVLARRVGSDRTAGSAYISSSSSQRSGRAPTTDWVISASNATHLRDGGEGGAGSAVTSRRIGSRYRTADTEAYINNTTECATRTRYGFLELLETASMKIYYPVLNLRLCGY